MIEHVLTLENVREAMHGMTYEELERIRLFTQRVRRNLDFEVRPEEVTMAWIKLQLDKLMDDPRLLDAGTVPGTEHP